MNEEILKNKYPFLSSLEIKVLYLIGKSKIDYKMIKSFGKEGINLYFKKYKNKIIDINKYNKESDEVYVSNDDVNTLFLLKKNKIPMKKVYDSLIKITNNRISIYPNQKDIQKEVKWALYKNKILNIAIMIFSFGVMITGASYLLNLNKDLNRTKDITASVIKEVVNEEKNVQNDDFVNVDEQAQSKQDYYFKFINETFLSMDINSLKQENKDTKGWIKVNGTNINYPFVQSKDNDYYLRHSFDGSKNKNGWVYLDYRNNIEDLDKNTIIYAHGAVNNTMFGSLRWVFNEKWYKEDSNRVIKVSTENADYIWEVFSVYTIEPEHYYITTSFSNDEEYTKFLNEISLRSVYSYNASLNEKDKILTLSSCYDNTKRMVLHAKLVATSSK